mmetsp:Transcript_36394/g.91902  ORF Transcript_36394/g.91902 Transcript_36394/m.91902 type:complete len:245 (+) Transcript_36394:1333-2067(+)
MSARPCDRWPLWMTPRPAVAENLAQLVARDSQSRLSRRNVSTVVPACMSALARMVAECVTLLRASTAPLMLRRICRSAWLWRYRKSRYSPMGVLPLRMFFRRSSLAAYAATCSGTSTAASGAGAAAAAGASVSMASPPALAPSAAPPFFSASFLRARSLALAVVDSTAVGSLDTSSFFSAVSGGRYACCDALQPTSNAVTGMARSALSPMSAVGAKDSDRKKDSGYQYQYCVNTARPMTAVRRK